MNDDARLHWPLSGVHLLEASAGTGKTFALVTWVADLLIRRGVPVTRILAMTFTDAATAELRQRLGQRLRLLARASRGEALDESQAEAAAAAAQWRQAAALGDAGLPRRLALAASQVDLMPIHTLHGFCARALDEHALLCGQAPQSLQLPDDPLALREEIASQLWRESAGDAGRAEALLGLAPSPLEFARAYAWLFRGQRPWPAAEAIADRVAPRARRQLAFDRLHSCWTQDAGTARDLLDAAVACGTLNRTSYKPALSQALWPALANWLENGDAQADPPEKLPLLGDAKLGASCNKDRKTGAPHAPPRHALFTAVDAMLAAVEAEVEARRGERLALLHELADLLPERLESLKRERGLREYEDQIGWLWRALHGPRGDALRAALRRQYAVALIDEFQDTDPRQWAIARRLFADAADAEPAALFLIGDPKQAIYRFRGGDIATYLAAAAQAEPLPPLLHNRRGRPRAVAAVNALLAGATDPFGSVAIRFDPAAAAGHNDDADCLLEGAPAPGLLLCPVAADADADDDDEYASVALPERIAPGMRACALQIARWLREGMRLRGDPLRARDCVVLVETHRQAQQARQALAAAGIPVSGGGGRVSVFDGAMAQAWALLLDALAQPFDDARQRAALAGDWFDADAAALRHWAQAPAESIWPQRFDAWREDLHAHGPLAVLERLLDETAAQLRRRVDGPRRLADAVQIGEWLQARWSQGLRAGELHAALQRARADADNEDEAQQACNDDDGRGLRVLTVHAAKGLEFELVFLPFAADRATARGSGQVDVALPEGRGRAVKAALAKVRWDAFREGDQQLSEQEARRLAYVALTRARQLTWVAVSSDKPALTRPIGRWIAGVDAPDPQAWEAGLQALLARGGGVVALRPAPTRLDAAAVAETTALPPPAEARRTLHADWWVHSFSQWVGGRALPERAAADDEGGEVADDPDDASPEASFAGRRIGNALHQVLERGEFAAWSTTAPALQATQQALLLQSLREHGYPDQAHSPESPAARLLRRWIGATVDQRLPEGARLAALPPGDQAREWEFHLRLPPRRMHDLLALLHAHGVARERDRLGGRERIEGLLTGKLDLLYRHAGRYYVLDYKSNRLPDYGTAALAQAIATDGYDLQYTLYTLALHRWLRTRLGRDYRYEERIGGVRYLFCRGLRPDDAAAPGLHALRPPAELIQALDALFGEGAGP